MNVIKVGYLKHAPNQFHIHTSDDSYEYWHYILFKGNGFAHAMMKEVNEYSDDDVLAYIAEFNSIPYNVGAIRTYPGDNLNVRVQIKYNRDNGKVGQSMRVMQTVSGLTLAVSFALIDYVNSLGSNVLNKQDEIKMLTLL